MTGRTAAIVLLALAGLVACGREEPGERPDRPNVLMIVLDTVRADRCSLTGSARPTTPFLESFGRDATVYTNCWSAAPWTGPSHATIFTGLRPENHGFLSGTRYYLSGAQTTLAEILSRNGYRTACLTNNDFVTETFGLVQGFERVEYGWKRDDSTYPYAVWTHDEAVEWVRDMRRRGESWFLFINDMEAHSPFTPTPGKQKEFLAPDAPAERVARLREYDGNTAVRWMLGRATIDARDWAILSDLYDAEISLLDGELRSLFDRLGNLDDTIVVVLSDHGENLSDHGLADHRFSLHRSLLHVPLLIRAPSGLPRGAVVGDLVRLEDLFPTILELVGLLAADEIDGRSLTADLAGRVGRAVFGQPRLRGDERDFRGFDGSRLDAGLRSVFDGRHHLIVGTNGATELYDVSTDPAEETNLADEESAVVRRFTELLPDLP